MSKLKSRKFWVMVGLVLGEVGAILAGQLDIVVGSKVIVGLVVAYFAANVGEHVADAVKRPVLSPRSYQPKSKSVKKSIPPKVK